MNKELNSRLIDVAYNVIEEEKLPRPKDIRLRNSLHGTRKRQGTCIKFNEGYRIIVHTSSAKFVKCKTGKFINKETGERYRRALGQFHPFEKLVEIMAHEIAHLRYWNHDAQHKSYYKHILQKLKDRLGLK